MVKAMDVGGIWRKDEDGGERTKNEGTRPGEAGRRGRLLNAHHQAGGGLDKSCLL